MAAIAGTVQTNIDRDPASNNLQEGLIEHRDAIVRFLVARVGGRDEAEDIVQELWLRCGKARTGPIANIRAYLYKAAHNLVRDRARQRARAIDRETRWADEADPADPISSNGGAPQEAQALASDEAARLRAAIDALPDGARRVLVMHKIEERSHAEIAGRLAISRSAVEKHMAVAMRHLRARLSDCGDRPSAASGDQQENKA
ncbi:RNA polymerase sigma factor [Sphingorhabdus soli]|uniref:RNA polymerase sigma factor n=1 Tax=Flavisphingopyxis soli TaxID=2601267 RepID=A0A5C6U6P4_9SPHN|nr:RNA polymerase sigma factor [Sphingorhabdus soli]TXC68653.1 RNA polymerase sigma factor [Sphingorhabdus soli]